MEDVLIALVDIFGVIFLLAYGVVFTTLICKKEEE